MKMSEGSGSSECFFLGIYNSIGFVNCTLSINGVCNCPNQMLKEEEEEKEEDKLKYKQKQKLFSSDILGPLVVSIIGAIHIDNFKVTFSALWLDD